MEVKASLKYARVGAQKARLVADLVRGKDVNEAVKTLTFLNKKTAGMVKKLIESAVANAEYKKVMDVDSLYVKAIWVDQGPVLKRFRPRAQGRAFGVRKKTSHINVVLEEK
ncbi:50S ribosomal protein L22 [Bdellovibrio bacteriovorus]|uniref:Large ribosomal subunit protein uL22 n=2 Tax=Bdellovibrio bacteriovorus TaxID=959 RepID=RL22_BDEBA|nr:50S ribosomal protein L22 [Bdellovibrio bacteriovorus]Q6MJ19.1 RecName: Full=Large ribosomal subunit protein uL22; AltName: Full=50S ribosomal protein L22 [Bdellovibrio bacteriovorus HD100]BFD60513.1 50S ribosomal protein L22 [Bdellovibrio sp. CKG001]BFD63928.1 50S ribosomal protein L22 [Bdellovibrio sp. HM001]BFD68116.1 50S ribosomal protein L22 [Bdellovibrio sp. HAGR004]AHZ83371.1 50S ribosomal protein L22 [Bdellovibrio bacteriovorus]ASD62864.1 50S ribosomal protein L22 [Bdellovibrio bac